MVKSVHFRKEVVEVLKAGNSNTEKNLSLYLL